MRHRFWPEESADDIELAALNRANGTPPGRDDTLQTMADADSADSLSLVSHYFRDAARYSMLGERAERRLSRRLHHALARLAEHRGLPEGTALTLRDVTEELLPGDLTSAHARRALRLASACRSTLIQSNLRLAVHLARRHANRGIPLIDLIQDGNVGLIKAVERFDPGKGFRFSTYAYWWISEEIKRSLKRGRRVVRTPEHVVDEIRALQSASQQLRGESGNAPDASALARRLGTSIRRIKELQRYALPEVSTDTPLSDSEDLKLGDALAAEPPRDQPETSLEPRDQKRLLGDILARLDPREQDILSRRFGLDRAEPETLQVISEALGLSRERVRQIEKGALAKLREQYADLAHMAGN
ncbi:sigma-70 family RNA polymerase sigma factor [Marinobacter bohaiensis]|uniref:sigma-70 family RNA polymerase sigma factor n=1 Tax=Marinobacter bohaiensis TaxID=2201898 RepID=UPI001D17B22F|nr:sigma-70 family RNA polymerase sigma factor [Marinobacter bohaiensis]